MNLYTYAVQRDFGFAPNPFGGVCSLACCKVRLRKVAEEGDWIVGIGGSKSGRQGRVMYAMVVEESLTFGEYWDDPRFQFKKPVLEGTHKGFFGDNIYSWDRTSGCYRQADSHHSHYDGTASADNIQRDLGVDRVLLSTDYLYLGADAVLPPDHISNLTGERFPRTSVRDYYGGYSPEMIEAVTDWLRSSFEWGLQGLPAHWDRAVVG